MNPLAHCYPSSLPRSTRFRVTAAGVALDVLTHPSADHTSFECDGPVAIEIECSECPADVKVRPLRLGIQPSVTGNRIRFVAPGPQALQVEVDGTHLLYVYALPPAKPAPQGPDVRVFRSGSVHEAGLIVLKDGETCWIEAGAVVRGSIRAADGAGFHIGGYGILDGGYWPSTKVAAASPSSSITAGLPGLRISLCSVRRVGCWFSEPARTLRSRASARSPGYELRRH